MGQRIVVIGGTAGGMSAAAKAKRENLNADVIVYEASHYISYGSCGLPYYVGDMIDQADSLVSMTPEEARKNRQIEVHTRHRVNKINRKNKKLEVENLEDGKIESVPYDFLVVATGASPIKPPISGMEAEGVHVLRNVEDGIGLKEDLTKDKGQTVGIIGGGFIGLETAEQISLLGNPVHIFEMENRLLPTFPESFGQKIKDQLTDHSVTVHLGTAVTDILTDKEDHISKIKLSDGSEHSLDILLVSVGVKPRTDLAKEAGLELGENGGILVDDHMRTSDDAIYACGDAIQMKNRITNKPAYVPLGTTANKTGRIAGANIAGGDENFQWILGSQITKVFDLYVGGTGLNESQAQSAGFEIDTVTIVQPDQAGYYPGWEKIWVHLVFEKSTGRILGAQLLGSKGIAGRINVFVTAISQGMTVEEINNLDLVYAPPVAPVYDPILIAASQALKKVQP